jgi:uncharacterized lipoprotein
MNRIRLILAAALLAGLAGCSDYTQVDDPSDGQNGKTKHPLPSAR